MPSSQVLPTIPDLLTAAGNALRGENDQYADSRRGSIHDHAAGPMAILFAREADRDRDLFRDTYLHDASGDALTTLVQGRFGTARVLSTAGMGLASFVRANATAGAGTLLEGTRVALSGLAAIYEIAADTLVGATQVAVAGVPIRSTVMGTGNAVTGAVGLTLIDPLYDPLWQPTTLTCADGTDYEPADEYRARALQLRLAARNGYLVRLVQVCQAQGAAYVIAFSSQYGLTTDDDGYARDYGLNAIYVADGNFQTSANLIAACDEALDSARVLGADLFVGGIRQSNLYAQAVVNLVDDPGRLDLVPIQRACTQSLVSYFAASSSGYTFKRDALTGAIKNAHPAVQQVADGGWKSPSADVTLAPNNWPATLTRYVLLSRNVNLSFVGPV